MQVQKVDDVTAIRDAVEIPGIGALAINAFVLHAEQPVLIDTGRPVERKSFMDALGSAIDPADIRWVWLTHPDRDHMGSLFDVLEAAPQARLVSTFLAVGYLTVEFDMPMDRLYLLNPGQALDVGDRKLHAFRPPTFDSPMTVGFYDDKTGSCISSDCFGAALPSVASAEADNIGDLPADEVRAGQLMWAAIDSPWALNTDVTKFRASYDRLRGFRPERVFSTHLPPAVGQFDTFLDMLEQVPSAEEWVGPDQAQMEAMMAGMVPEQPTGTERPVTA